MRVRILQVADIHASQKGLNTLRNAVASEKPDLVIICGDITHFGPYEFAGQVLGLLKHQVFVVLGNCDMPDTFEKVVLHQNIVHLHGITQEFQGVKFSGFGGANGTPWAYGNLYTEEEIYDALRKLVGETTILVTHTPPVSFVRARISEEMGSTAVDRVVQERKPLAVLCGHIHEADGVERIFGKTLVVNPGPAKHGRYAVVEVEGSKVEARINAD
ncbi:MAG: metallophosphoesterase [Thermoplasmata archaeon]|nr:metallophosphoesterase [Thermoplasmata archaeon]